jgi:hypothetical protein
MNGWCAAQTSVRDQVVVLVGGAVLAVDSEAGSPTPILGGSMSTAALADHGVLPYSSTSHQYIGTSESPLTGNGWPPRVQVILGGLVAGT